MRKELFARGILSSEEFDNEVRRQSVDSQLREGMQDPYGEEPREDWQERQRTVRAHLTDLHFANNLPFARFEDIVNDVLQSQGIEGDDILSSFNPEFAPQEALFEQARAIAALSPEERAGFAAREREIKVVLIRSTISDQLAYINIAKEWFSLDDLIAIRRHKIGKGRIGGKAAGMLLALRILQGVADKDLVNNVTIPESHFLGADVMYSFMAQSNLMHWGDQKYKDEERIRADYEQIQKEYAQGEFPEEILEDLRLLVEKFKGQPLIVRSSSLLEDNFGTSFAGKYDSFFCPNQGTTDENLKELTRAIAQVYASGLNPDALLYRRSRGLQDYDERLAVLIQAVQGERYEDYYFPHLAGVAFSRNLFRWSPKINREDGFLRLVWGLGTRAVEHLDNDYPRLVALSHPELRASADIRSIRSYSQHWVDVIDLKENEFRSLPVSDVLSSSYPYVRSLASVYKDGDLSEMRSLVSAKKGELVLTFDKLIRDTNTAAMMRDALHHLETHYQTPVDMEFTIALRKVDGKIVPKLYILQCRPQSQLQDQKVSMPREVAAEQVVFRTSRVAPHGIVKDIKRVLFVSPEAYFGLPTPEERSKLSRTIGELNKLLADESFICVGPGRWGTVNPDLGIKVSYADIYNARALVELSDANVGPAPEPSYGTHFFQDLLEANIYPLAIHLDDEDAVFNREFFYKGINHIAELIPDMDIQDDLLRVLNVEDFMPAAQLELVMDSEEGHALAYLTDRSSEDQGNPKAKEN
jgi:hypothetical protein